MAAKVPMLTCQLAQRLRMPSQDVSEIMGELEGIGAIIRHRERMPGMRSSGRVRYFLSPVVIMQLAGGERDTAQAEASPGPLLRVMQGGKTL